MAAIQPGAAAAGGVRGNANIPGLQQWIMEIPPVTRAWIIGSVAISMAVQCKYVAPLQLYFSYKSAFQNHQPWRLVTAFLYFGPVTLDLAFHLFFIMRYSRLLEENNFAGKKADYLCLLIFNASILLVISPLLTLPFLSASLAFSLVYIWSRRNPSQRLNILGLVNITAPHLPYFLMGFSYFMYGGWDACMGDAVGAVAGHIYYFLMDVWPREMWYPGASKVEKGNVEGPIKAPRWM
ncbi:hypothetical protein FFLO_06173 [Filobasidium floriforme]|uniref:Derlin n=1 Tax=Filobasidium floriforme TaxID=5210 RepID=A0A8K0JFX0_9TREE|nr:Der1-like family-domain-containing protein [Filobasidium floriforme]KAG7528427.1 hypothetical protein FFLO_06173 [Filobasidium floriforme]KAH8078338.1 Der1-like family-domain-containing protein [Filobasidium floriforme]